MMTTQGRTRRSPDGMWAGGGAVNQHGGKLPIYICNTCGSEVVWAESKRTGRKYLANISHGANGHRFYIGANIHDCAPVLARRDDEEWKRESFAHFSYLLHLRDEHEDIGHPESVPSCIFCERGR